MDHLQEEACPIAKNSGRGMMNKDFQGSSRTMASHGQPEGFRSHMSVKGAWRRDVDGRQSSPTQKDAEKRVQ